MKKAFSIGIRPLYRTFLAQLGALALIPKNDKIKDRGDFIRTYKQL